VVNLRLVQVIAQVQIAPDVTAADICPQSEAASTMSVKLIPAVLHATSMSIMAYGFMSLGTVTSDEWISKQTGGHWQFLTILGLAAAWITMALSLLGDLFPYSQSRYKWNKKVTVDDFTAGFDNCVGHLLYVRHTIKCLPLRVTYFLKGTLLLAFPHLILPPVGTSSEPAEPSSSSEVPQSYRLPLKIDLALHLAPSASLILDFFTLERRYTARQLENQAPFLSILAAVSYATWAEYCASKNGAFPYPFLTMSPFHIRVVIYGVTTLLAYLSLLGLNYVHL
ncbi:unnamed protein product, partial [Rhizoctonia solani]